jgi:hypothetical protein
VKALSSSPSTAKQQQQKNLIELNTLRVTHLANACCIQNTCGKFNVKLNSQKLRRSGSLDLIVAEQGSWGRGSGIAMVLACLLFLAWT